MRTGGDGAGGTTDRFPIPDDGLASGDIAQCELVTHGNRFAQHDAHGCSCAPRLHQRVGRQCPTKAVATVSSRCSTKARAMGSGVMRCPGCCAAQGLIGNPEVAHTRAAIGARKAVKVGVRHGAQPTAAPVGSRCHCCRSRAKTDGKGGAPCKYGTRRVFLKKFKFSLVHGPYVKRTKSWYLPSPRFREGQRAPLALASQGRSRGCEQTRERLGVSSRAGTHFSTAVHSTD